MLDDDEYFDDQNNFYTLSNNNNASEVTNTIRDNLANYLRSRYNIISDSEDEIDIEVLE
ncbi:hypothetical protein C1646_707166 [Rhizophagus diaphanus]|nr:hypothetical protein C1646_707166 [Rhizophagus diaphanus] [Rhizophagus sp. MUCL 43196]